MEKDNPRPRERTPFEKFQELTKRVIAVPKSEVDKREAEWKQQRAGRKARSTKAR